MSIDTTAVRTVTVAIEGMHCGSCPLLVDDCMEDVSGVQSSQTDLRSGQCVAVVAGSVTDDAILAAVTEAGYSGSILESAAAPSSEAGVGA